VIWIRPNRRYWSHVLKPLQAKRSPPNSSAAVVSIGAATEAEAALGLPPGAHSYALLPIGYPMGRFGPVRRIPLSDVVYEVSVTGVIAAR
jgi:hypothetical protein